MLGRRDQVALCRNKSGAEILGPVTYAFLSGREATTDALNSGTRSKIPHSMER